MTAFAAVLRKSVRDQRHGLLGWGVALVALVWVEAAIWPTIQDMPDFEQLLQQYPEAFRKLFDIEAMATGQGFINGELFTFMLPILFIVFAVGRAARETAGEEESGQLDPLLVTNASRSTIALAKATGVVVGTVAIGLVLAVALVTASLTFDLGISVSSAAAGSLAMALLGVEFGLLAIAVGIATGRRALALTATGCAAVAAYVVYVAAQFVDELEPLSDWTPMGQVLTKGPLGAGVQASYLWMALSGLLVLAIALPLFARRDIRSH